MTTFFTWQHAILKSELEPTTKLVCHTIGCHMAADGSGCFPSYQTIADESGLGRSTVISHVGKAVDAGYLEAESRQRRDGSNSSNLYRQSFPPSPAAGLGWSNSGTGGSPAAGPPLTTQSNNPDNTPLYPPNQRKSLPVQTLANASQTILRQAEASRPSNGESGHIPPSAGTLTASDSNGTTSPTAGTAGTPREEGGRRKSDWAATWRSHCRRQSSDSRRGYRAGGKARSGFATAFASSVANRYGIPSAGGGVGGGRPPKAPERTPDLVLTVSQTVKSLSDLLTPASQRGPELEAQILKMFAAFNLYTGDQGKLNAMVEVWADELEEFPMFAIRKVYKWAVGSEGKLPTLAAFIADVRFATGRNVYARFRLLQGWLQSGGTIA